MSDFAKWLKTNTGLSDSSIYKYSHAADTVMEEMLALGVISKPFYEMTEIEIDIAIAVICLPSFPMILVCTLMLPHAAAMISARRTLRPSMSFWSSPLPLRMA